MSLRRLVLLAIAVAALAVPAGAYASAPISSDNVHLLTRLPEAVGAISARFSPDGRLMYVSTASGLLIYDVSQPESPARVGALPLPHFENEDVDVGDGVVVLTNDPSFTEAGMIYVIDVRDPSKPAIRSTINTYLPGNPLDDPGQTGNGHILNCIQACRYLWSTGTEEGITVYDLRDLDHPAFMGKFELPEVSRSAGAKATPGFTHDVFVDRSGIGWITGEDGTFGYDTTGDPVHPQLLYRSDENVKNTGGGFPGDDGSGPLDFLHHNSIRTDLRIGGATGGQSGAATAGVVENAGAGAVPAMPSQRGTTTRKRSVRLTKADRRALKRCDRKRSRSARSRCRAAVRRRAAARARRLHRQTTLGGLGDVMAVTEEDYLKPGCDGQGSLQTWQITDGRNSDGTTKLTMLDQWTTELNELQAGQGRSPATVNCSAHWFDESNGLLAQGWYDQGVRFTDISDPRNIRQVGYFITAGTYWAAYFAPADVTRQTVYALDTAGGIDVLHIDRAGSLPVQAPVLERWTKGARTDVLAASPRWGFICPLLAQPVREAAAAAFPTA